VAHWSTAISFSVLPSELAVIIDLAPCSFFDVWPVEARWAAVSLALQHLFGTGSRGCMHEADANGLSDVDPVRQCSALAADAGRVAVAWPDSTRSAARDVQARDVVLGRERLVLLASFSPVRQNRSAAASSARSAPCLLSARLAHDCASSPRVATERRAGSPVQRARDPGPLLRPGVLGSSGGTGLTVI
jgi:hypothetical protein